MTMPDAATPAPLDEERMRGDIRAAIATWRTGETTGHEFITALFVAIGDHATLAATPAPLDERPPALPPANPSLMSSLDDEVVLWNPEPLEHFPMSSPHDTSDRRCSCGELLTCPAATPAPLDEYEFVPYAEDPDHGQCPLCGEDGTARTDVEAYNAALRATPAPPDGSTEGDRTCVHCGYINLVDNCPGCGEPYERATPAPLLCGYETVHPWEPVAADDHA